MCVCVHVCMPDLVPSRSGNEANTHITLSSSHVSTVTLVVPSPTSSS